MCCLLVCSLFVGLVGWFSVCLVGCLLFSVGLFACVLVCPGLFRCFLFFCCMLGGEFFLATRRATVRFVNCRVFVKVRARGLGAAWTSLPASRRTAALQGCPILGGGRCWPFFIVGVFKFCFSSFRLRSRLPVAYDVEFLYVICEWVIFRDGCLIN